MVGSKEGSMVEDTEATRRPEPMWRCQVKGCSYSTPPTLHGYSQITGHQLYHAKQGLSKEEKGFRLIDQNTGEMLAESLKEARDKNLLEPSPKKPTPAIITEPAKELTEKDDEVSETVQPQISSKGIFSYTISLPADAFALFNIAKAAGLEKDGEKSFDAWVWDCIKKRFEKDYKRRLVLAAIGEE